jgi:hypothetical protein
VQKGAKPLMVYLEFVVVGVPISNLSPGPNLQNWRAAVAVEAKKVWKKAALTGKLKAVIINFHLDDKPSLDVDNMSKPILDVLEKIVYDNDRQIRQAEITHVRIDAPFVFVGASKLVVTAVQAGNPFVYVRIEDPVEPSHSPSDLMDFEQELMRLAGSYTAQGYQIIIRPGPDDLPSFAKDFKVEIVGKRATEGVLVAVKRNRDEFAADANLPRYAEVTAAQPGWRFDFAILEAEAPGARDLRGAQELSGEDIDRTLADAEKMIHADFTRAAVLTAWAGLEAAMRMRLRAAGEDAGWGTTPRGMLNELYSSGVFAEQEFRELERLYQLRNRIVHGFAAPASEAGVVQFLNQTARRLLAESQRAKQPA